GRAVRRRCAAEIARPRPPGPPPTARPSRPGKHGGRPDGTNHSRPRHHPPPRSAATRTAAVPPSPPRSTRTQPHAHHDVPLPPRPLSLPRALRGTAPVPSARPRPPRPPPTAPAPPTGPTPPASPSPTRPHYVHRLARVAPHPERRYLQWNRHFTLHHGKPHPA